VRGRRLITGVLVLAAACLAIGCAMPGRVPGTPRSPLEQLLLSQAIERSAGQVALGLPEGTSVILDSSSLAEDQDLDFITDTVEGWLGQQGIAVREKGDEAQYRLRMIVESAGNEQAIHFFGLMQARSAYIPIALPEIALYKKVHNEGFVRLYFDIFEAADGRYVRSSSPVAGEAEHTRYTFFVVFKWHKTNMTSPPADFERID
jgi:hypothetical protein